MDQHVKRRPENNEAFRTILAIIVAVPKGVQCCVPSHARLVTRPPFSLPPRTTTLLLGHYRFQRQSVPPSKKSAIRAPCVGANQCHCAIARPWCTQRLAIPSAGRESGDARGWIRYFHLCLGERNGARDWRKRREQNATIVVRSGARLKRSAPFLARRRSHRHRSWWPDEPDVTRHYHAPCRPALPAFGARRLRPSPPSLLPSVLLPLSFPNSS